MSQALVNANPVVYQVAASKRSIAPEDLNDEVRDSIDNQEIFGIIHTYLLFYAYFFFKSFLSFFLLVVLKSNINISYIIP